MEVALDGLFRISYQHDVILAKYDAWKIIGEDCNKITKKLGNEKICKDSHGLVWCFVSIRWFSKGSLSLLFHCIFVFTYYYLECAFLFI